MLLCSIHTKSCLKVTAKHQLVNIYAVCNTCPSENITTTKTQTLL